MKIYIDQSGKVEDTGKPTVLAFTNKDAKVIKVLAKTKRQIQEVFRRKGAPRLYIYRTFGALVFLLIRDFLPKLTQVVIDTEYPGKEKIIKEIIIEFIRKEKKEEPTIFFKRIGNRPKVHYLAYDVFVGKKKEDKLIKFEEVVKLTIKK